MNLEESRLLTVKEVSKKLQISECTVYRYIRNGLIEAVSLYNRKLVDEKKLGETIIHYSVGSKEACELSGVKTYSALPNRTIPSNYDYFSVKEVAFLLRCSTKTIYRKIEERTLPSTKIGGKILISKRDLEEYINNVKRGDAPKDD